MLPRPYHEALLRICLPFVVILFSLFSCAGNSANTGLCDPTQETCTCDGPEDCPVGWHCTGVICTTDDGGLPDGSVDTVDTVTDVSDDDVDVIETKREFGDTCTQREECISNICLFVATGGFCSKTCIDSSNCPNDYNCLGVMDAIEQGQIAYVCVPTGDMLCTTCQTHSECSLIGQDLCLPYANGSFCARDCRTVSCPIGYTCTDVVLGGQNYRQCIPDSGACDCNANNPGTTENCLISTPLGVCTGTRTCEGTAGWGACLPPAPVDEPDATYADDDCDGIDGDLDGGVFVSVTGTDTPGCGGDYSAISVPYCKSVSYGIEQAAAAGLSYVYVQAGRYEEVVVLSPGIHVIGGYDTAWKRGPRTQGAHEVTITGGLDNFTGQYMTVRAHDLSVTTRMMDLVLVGPSTIGGLPDGSGHSSYVVHALRASGLQVERVSFIAGHGASGRNGTDGSDAPTVTATSSMHGTAGQDAYEGSYSCNDSGRGAGGSRGVNTCSGGLSPNGGAGGAGGTMDTYCGGIFNSNYDATSGQRGGNADQWASGNYGYGGAGGYASSDTTSGPGAPGNNGRVQNGAGGAGGIGGRLVGDYWYAYPGEAGGIGANGGGGGGGGGSGGSDFGIDSWGAGGGGGGAGGCAAVSGGGGGGGGGGSFGLFAIDSDVTVTDCTVIRGTAGAGGAGGTGGRGQSPGNGGPGGAANGDSAAGGAGGRGGHGGHGGGGGGGAGGVSYAFYTWNATITQNCVVQSGSAGAAGAGGLSAPSAPVGENDGNPGMPGSVGVLDIESSCVSINNCP